MDGTLWFDGSCPSLIPRDGFEPVLDISVNLVAPCTPCRWWSNACRHTHFLRSANVLCNIPPILSNRNTRLFPQPPKRDPRLPHPPDLQLSHRPGKRAPQRLFNPDQPLRLLIDLRTDPADDEGAQRGRDLGIGADELKPAGRAAVARETTYALQRAQHGGLLAVECAGVFERGPDRVDGVRDFVLELPSEIVERHQIQALVLRTAGGHAGQPALQMGRESLDQRSPSSLGGRHTMYAVGREAEYFCQPRDVVTTKVLVRQHRSHDAGLWVGAYRECVCGLCPEFASVSRDCLQSCLGRSNDLKGYEGRTGGLERTRPLLLKTHVSDRSIQCLVLRLLVSCQRETLPLCRPVHLSAPILYLTFPKH